MNDRERNQAIKEAHNIAASEAYFEVRAGVVNPQPHTIFDAGFSRGWDAGRAAIEAHEARTVPDGWKLVPIEPTKEMIDAYVRDPHRFFSARTDWAAMLASAPPAPQHENETINNLRAGYPAAIDAAIREQASVVKHEPVAEITKAGENVGVVEWLVHSGRPIRVGQALYTHPAPVREPLTDAEIIDIQFSTAGQHHTERFLNFARAIEAAHGITKDTPKPRRKASADFDLPAPNDDIGDTQ